MSPSLAPASMNAGIASVYIVIASCTPWIVVSRSATICEIDTFITLLSSTITNCADPSTAIGSHAKLLRASCSRSGAGSVTLIPAAALVAAPTGIPARRQREQHLDVEADQHEREQRLRWEEA